MFPFQSFLYLYLFSGTLRVLIKVTFFLVASGQSRCKMVIFSKSFALLILEKYNIAFWFDECALSERAPNSEKGRLVISMTINVSTE